MVDELLSKKSQMHGSFYEVSRRFLRISSAILQGAKHGDLSPEQQTAIYMIAMKLARIVEGDSNHPDHWVDIQGYARLAEMSLDNVMHQALKEELERIV